ncbi:uncharacterized protein LOC106156690 isoform X2 [Lingula anatina]|nr:uncharacterized protein LOC106156690 isoform X2 [Lingula anatina]XP_013387517.1 uncharacterized protein LOC106156690 isoform X2 [Lingula anatina]|eukprot:XP_013387516.1 uncharacterized protein LOC106156690 isoform X2 [Lingula anatina]
MSNIRKFYDPQYHGGGERKDQNGNVGSQGYPPRPGSAPARRVLENEGHTQVPQGNPGTRHYPEVNGLVHQKNMYNAAPPEILPGLMAKDDAGEKTEVREPIMSTTELDPHGVSQHGANQRRQQLANVTLMNNRPRSAKAILSPVQHQPPASVSQAWSGAAANRHNPVATVSPSVEERLRSLLNEQDATHHQIQGYDEGELLLPPPPQVRTPLSHDEGIDNPSLEDDVKDTAISRLRDKHQRSPSTEGDDGYQSAYVPSQPDEKRQGPRGQVLLDRMPQHALSRPPPHLYTSDSSTNSSFNISTKSPGKQREMDNSNSDLRDACNRLYSKDRNTSLTQFAPAPLSRPTSATGPRPYLPPGAHHGSGSHSSVSPTSSSSAYTTQPGGGSTSPDSSNYYRSQLPNTGGYPRPNVGNTGKFVPPGVGGSAQTSQSVGPLKERYLKQQRELNNRPPVAPGQQHISQGEPAKLYDEIGSGLMSWMHKTGPQDNKGMSFLANFTRGMPSTTTHFNPGFINGDLSGDEENDFGTTMSDTSSMTPPLPPLSPSNTPPATPPDSPTLPQFARSNSNVEHSLSRPDLILSSATGNLAGRKKPVMRRASSEGTNKKSPAKGSPVRKQQPSKMGRAGASLSDVKEYEEDTDTGQDSAAWDTNDETQDNKFHDSLDSNEATIIREQLDALETMYHEILKLLGVDKTSKMTNLMSARKKFGSSSTISRGKGGKGSIHRGRGPMTKDSMKNINKRFARLESHVVTLARSVAHLSSELRSQNTMYEQLEALKKDVREMKEQQLSELAKNGINPHVEEWERFRGWVPSLTNPKRVNKLTKFFGTEPPLLQIFLKKLGYEKYIHLFEKEHIGMVELPYMTDERLEKIGIPLGPRLRILQESQMCFRQENFNIYIV